MLINNGAIDPNSYIIFEHLGTDAEEQQWANYRIAEGKGVMMWITKQDLTTKIQWDIAKTAILTEWIMNFTASRICTELAMVRATMKKD